jgi:DNA-binding MarR family transcriptional regulator
MISIVTIETGDQAPSAEGSDLGSNECADGAWPTGLVPASVVDDGPSLDSSTPFRGIGFTLSSIGYAVARRFRETLAPLQLEPREFALLRAVGLAEGQSQQAIGERLHIPPSRMVALVDALEARTLLERRHNPDDRRTRELYLTDDGRRLIGSALELAVALEHDLTADFDLEDRECLRELLQRVGGRLGVAPGVHSSAHDDSDLAAG